MGKVLMFHRVLPQVLIPQKNAYATFGTLIAQTYFEEVLQLLHDNQFDIVTISKLTELIKCNENTGNCIALTFDDGYSDNYDFAFPLLLKFGMTATFFPVVEPCKTNAVLPLDIYYHCVDEMELSQEEREELITGELKKKFYWEEPSVQKVC